MVVIFSELLDSIRNASRADKEALAQELIDDRILLRETLANQQKAASDARRNTAKTFITNTVEPQLTTPTGNYAAQHAQFIANFNILDTEIGNAVDGETEQELKKRLETERQAFNTLRQNHASGVIR